MADSINHNIRVIHIVTGEHVICNFTQIREEDKFVAYQLLYPLALRLDPAEEDTYNVSYRRWNPYTPYEDHKVAPTSVISAMPPAPDILKNYVGKLKEAGVNLSFLPNDGADILGETTQSATTEGPVVDSDS